MLHKKHRKCSKEKKRNAQRAFIKKKFIKNLCSGTNVATDLKKKKEEEGPENGEEEKFEIGSALC